MNSHNSEVPTKKSGSTKIRKRWILLGALLLVSLGVYLLPKFLGTKWLYQPLFDRLAAQGLVADIETIEVDWFSPLKIREFSLREEGQPPILEIPEIRNDRGLFGLLTSWLWGGGDFGTIHVIDPGIDVRILDDKAASLEKILIAIGDKSNNKDAKPRELPKIDLQLAIHGFHAKVQRADQAEPLVVIPPADLRLSYLSANGDQRVVVEPTELLHEVELTQELLRFGLGHAIPLLAESAWFDGRVSMALEKWEIPLKSPEDARGSATISLHQVRSGPKNPTIVQVLDFISMLRQNDSPNEGYELVFIDGSKIEIAMADRRVSHRGLQVGLPKVDRRLQLTSSGSVGLDRSLDMAMEFPVPLEQIARRDSVKELGVPMVRLPLSGTLDKPEVDWQSLRKDSAGLVGLIKSRVEADSPGTAAALGAIEGIAGGQADEAIEAAADLFRAIRDKRREKNAASDKLQEIDREQKSDAAPSRPLRDRLRNILRGNGQ